MSDERLARLRGLYVGTGDVGANSEVDNMRWLIGEIDRLTGEKSGLQERVDVMEAEIAAGSGSEWAVAHLGAKVRHLERQREFLLMGIRQCSECPNCEYHHLWSESVLREFAST